MDLNNADILHLNALTHRRHDRGFRLYLDKDFVGVLSNGCFEYATNSLVRPRTVMAYATRHALASELVFRNVEYRLAAADIKTYPELDTKPAPNRALLHLAAVISPDSSARAMTLIQSGRKIGLNPKTGVVWPLDINTTDKGKAQ